MMEVVNRSRRAPRALSRLGVWSNVLLALGVLCFQTHSVRAQGAGGEFLTQMNNLSSLISGNKAAEEVLFPAVAAMDDCPVPCRDDDDLKAIMLLTPDSPGWSELAAWSQGEPQRKAIEALATVTDQKQKYMLSLPYGRAGVDEAWIKAGLSVDIGDPPLLALAEFHYLDSLRSLVALVNVEAAGLASDGSYKEALTILRNWMYLSRMLIDRHFLHEKLTSLRWAMMCTERIRDIVYQHQGEIDEQVLVDLIYDFDPRVLKGVKIMLPEGDRIAAKQIVEMTFVRAREVKPTEFAMTMARISSGGEPLMLFSEAAWWGELAATHAGYYETLDEIDKLYGDWTTRWGLQDFHDPLLERLTDFDKMDRRRFALVAELIGDVGEMFDLRMKLLTELAGTRQGLGVVAFRKRNRVWPPELPSLKPHYVVKDLDFDPYHYDDRFRTYRILEYFVPIRDENYGPRDEPKPYEIEVITKSIEELQAEAVAAAESAETPALSLDGLGDMLARRAAEQGAPEDAELARRVGDGIAESVNLETWEVDKEKLRDVMHKAINADPAGPEEVMQLTFMFQMIANSGVTADNVEAKLEELMQEQAPPGFEQSISEFRDAAGIDMEELKGWLGALARDLLSGATAQEMLVTAQSGGAITAAQANKLAHEVIDTLVTDKHLDPAMEMARKLMSSPMGAALAAGMMAGAGPSFTVALDQDDFVLYSVGKDGQDNEARTVGPGGADILLWPPIISLERQQIQ